MWEKIKRNRFWTSLLAALIFILMALLFQGYLQWQNSPSRITRHLEKQLQEKVKLLTIYMQLFEQNKVLTGKELQSMNEEGMSVFLYVDDSLAYWSTNTFSAPNYLTPEPAGIYPRVQKTINGWYYVIREGGYQRMIEGRILIKHNYPFQNDYLVNDFQKDFRIPKEVELSIGKGEHQVFLNTKYLCSIKIPDEPPLTRDDELVLLALFLTSIVLLILALYQFLISSGIFKNKITFIIAFTGAIVLLRLMQVWLKIPYILYSTKIFGPESFSSSFFFPSLGDFMFNAICFLVISWVFYRMYSQKISRPNGRFRNYLFALLCLLALAAEVFVAVFIVRELIVNSTIPFYLQDISSLNLYSIVGFIIFSSVFLAIFFIGVRLMGWLTIFLGLRNRRWIRGIRIGKYSVTNLVIYLVMFSAFATAVMNHYNIQVEKEKRKLLAIKLAAERDPLTEVMYARLEPALLADSLLKTFFRKSMDDDTIIRYLQNRYFKDYWNNYSIQVTNCFSGKILRVQPQNYLVPCEKYFRNILSEIGQPTPTPGFYFLDYGYGFKNYLSIIPYVSEEGDSLTAYLELSSKLIFRDLGYPELLIDKRQVQLPDLSGYSYAFYRNEKLVNRVGTFHYSMDLSSFIIGHQNFFFSSNGISHYFHKVGENRTLVISKKQDTLFDKIAPFSYFFLFFGLFTIIFYVIINFPWVFKSDWFSLGARLQLTMSVILFSSLIIIGGLMVYYIIRLNTQKNYENLSERVHSILIELQHTLGPEDNFNTNNGAQLEELLTKFSNVFFSDVNIYDTNGRLLATSRPEIFDAGLVSRRMTGEAFRNMREKRSSYFMAEEKVGNSAYSSAYMPFYNENNKLMAYLNLPYFTRQEELKREVSSFLIAFVNIYVFLLITGLIISLFISRYITRPLRLLTANIGRLGYGRKNEKLEWSRNDEVGKLVDEYNRMVDELEKSAGLLARSERESAWREMARQVAHEIKNPLTPMKLSVQHLQRAWRDKAPDWEERLRRFTDTMTEQIETLAEIASVFSDFAKMPLKHEELIDIQELIDSTLVLYRDIASIHFIFNPSTGNNFILGDRKQLNRVFTNLINNAVYAVGEKSEGVITISVVSEKDAVLITISDNGSGISRDQAEHIFQPNFTTKSGGMGLGLAIVKSIVQGTSGEIHFHSEEGKGTTFMLRFPLVKQ